MKLLVVGSAPQSNIYLKSTFVSGYHAEIIILDNGDIFVIDKNSTNGTTVNGSKVTPGIEVPIRRGEQVMFADTPLDWGSIPVSSPDPQAKKLIGVGSHNRNQIKLNSDKVSRFHATIKQNADGKWYICDHSTNGTTVNGQRIPKDVYVRIKKKDEIKCAGVPVNNPANTGTSASGLTIGIIAASVAVVAGIVAFIILHPWGMSDEQIHAEYENSVVFIQTGYHFKVSAGALDIKNTLSLKTDEFVINEYGGLDVWDGKNSEGVVGTGFFISEDGLIATNLHVIESWKYQDAIQAATEKFKLWLNSEAVNYDVKLLNYLSDVKVEGVLDYIYITPNKSFYTGMTNSIRCIEIVGSPDTEIDLAVIQSTLKGGVMPENAHYVNLHKVPASLDYKTGSHVYTLGFPIVSDMLKNLNNKPLNANGSSGSIQNQVSEYTFSHSAIIAGGASGSPMFNDKGQIIGVVNSMDSANNDYKHSVKIEYLIELLDGKKIKY